MANGQIIVVDDIVGDDPKLEETASQLLGETVTIASEEVGSDFLMMDESVGAVLVKKQSAHGAFRVTGRGTQSEVPNIVTGPSEAGFVIVAIKAGQTGMCFGRPSIRRFSRMR
ncbi:hypothetical protein BS50DRAFT_580402 [Corynespora cassiicola Philippines]|uniref:Uncharacterized protein n=1 Tax=Corynespora cassiicola Philippines TaxID=1448308 RepID=A0A2T2N093_CORCC|nr:hypothetical protein BS50DRAFT_580402 [Corynespora cassiicola Philippines]